MNKKRQIAASDYTEQLSNIEQIQLPEVAKNCTSVFHIYQIRIQNRDKLQKFLFDNGISTMVHYPVPPHLQKAYKSLGFKKGDFPISEKNSDTTLSLPMDPFIEKGQVDYICDTIKNFLNINK
jgi:dTDP-4-amino-4,6-dideoxygalactose transaminase